MITLVKEDGTGVVGANTYADLTDATSYFETHLYATDWTGATNDERRKAALVMAARTLDASFDWFGYKTHDAQPLQWPRSEVNDPNAARLGEWNRLRLGTSGPYLDENAVPVEIQQAQMELARFLLAGDRTADPQGQGLKSVRIEGALEVVFDTASAVPVVPDSIRNLLSNFGTYKSRDGRTVKLSRV